MISCWSINIFAASSEGEISFETVVSPAFGTHSIAIPSASFTPSDFSFSKFPEFKLSIDKSHTPNPDENDGFCSPTPSEEPLPSPPRSFGYIPRSFTAALVPDPSGFFDITGPRSGFTPSTPFRRTKPCPPTPVRLVPHRLMRTSSLSDSKLLDQFHVDTRTTVETLDSDFFCNDFCDHKEIGRGSFFVVYRVRSKTSGEEFAVVCVYFISYFSSSTSLLL